MEFTTFSLYGVTAGIVFFTLYLVAKRRVSPHRLSLPPGPKGIPFLGSALEINKNEPWITYEKWKKMYGMYGEIVSCNLLGQNCVIINSERVAKLLLDQRSNIYSDRPAIHASILFGTDFNTGRLSYGDTCRSYRKLFHQGLDSLVIHKYHDSIAKKTRTLLENLLHFPDRFEDHVRTYAASIVMSVTYGYNVMSRNDPLMAPLEEMIRNVTLVTPERTVLLNLFPQILRFPSWFPGGELRRIAKRCKELSPMVRDVPFQSVKECLSNGTENDSIVARLLKDETVLTKDRKTYEQNIKDCAVSNFLVGTETTQSTLTTLIMALILHPEVQDRAQSIIDSVVWRDRMPSFDDRASLQYIDAVLLETMRWGALVPLALPHMVSKDDFFERQLIPEGAIIIPNLRGMAWDEERFPDPAAFKPERHLDADGNVCSDDISSLWFGYGRRICPGRYLADASTWLAAAGMLAVFRFSKAIGPAGYEIDIFPRFTGGIALRPVPFKCRIMPRFEGANDLVN